ncbi:MAG TPA: SRPBCC family protein [Chloroflexia bacterium]|nr:SRPBCC family protein [Chloroflexia bacterium]
MAKPQLVYVTYIATTPERLWEALTGGEFTRIYWYNRRIESEWQVGSPVAFYDGDSQTVTDKGEVLTYEPPRKLAYTFRYMLEPGGPFSEPSRVSFSLEPDGGLVKLTLIHDQLPDEETVDGFREGWAPIISSLKTYLETGKPLERMRKFEEQGRVEAQQSSAKSQ